MHQAKHILMVASENDGLYGGKVGGIGDVLRDVPPFLAREGYQVTVLTPSYGFLQCLNPVKTAQSFSLERRSGHEEIHLIHLGGKRDVSRVHHAVLDHPGLITRNSDTNTPHIYAHDPPHSPFATDANRFSFFCLAAARAVMLGLLGDVHVIHLHDWHAAFFLLLARKDPTYHALSSHRYVFTIHNLALQGIRPLAGHNSCLCAWYPDLPASPELISDPRWPDCINPMAVGIRLADKVHAVSPSYALEITQASVHTDKHHYYGGEGLEEDLSRAMKENRLFGILNGCTYDRQPAEKLSYPNFLLSIKQILLHWIAEENTVKSAHILALEKIHRLLAGSGTPPVVLTSVSRIVEQKVRILLQRTAKGSMALEHLLRELEGDGIYCFLGTGMYEYQRTLRELSARLDNFLYLEGYSNQCADLLYEQGDVFLMPSSYEPCGISQMLAMRAGQPCVVHNVGGLKDTVTHLENGFVFEGPELPLVEQADNFVLTCIQAVQAKKNPGQWQYLVSNAASSLFPWQDSIHRYIHALYS